MAFVGASPLASGTTTCLPVYASAVAGHLLVALVSGEKTATVAFTISGATTGWTKRATVQATSITTEIWDKIASGSDTMPTWNMSGGAYMRCIVAEFSGTTTPDQNGTATGTTTPKTVTASGTDGGTGRLIVSAVTLFRQTNNATATVTHNINGQGVGTGINVLGNDGGTSQGTHHHSVYSTSATTGSVADSDVMAWSTIITGLCALAIASYSSGSSIATGGTGNLHFAGSGAAIVVEAATGTGHLAMAGSGAPKVGLTDSGVGHLAFSASGTSHVGLAAAGNGHLAFVGSGTATGVVSGTGALVMAGSGRVIWTARAGAQIGGGGGGSSSGRTPKRPKPEPVTVSVTGDGTLAFQGIGDVSVVEFGAILRRVIAERNSHAVLYHLSPALAPALDPSLGTIHASAVRSLLCAIADGSLRVKDLCA